MRVEVNGVRIFFEVAGAKLRPRGAQMIQVPTLLVLHGGPGMDHTLGLEEFQALQDVCQVIAMDHRGHGRSGGWEDESSQTLAQWGDDVHAFCEALDIAQPIVLGTSFGGMVAQSYATRHPEHPAGLILNSTSPRVVLEEIYEAFHRLEGAEAARIARAAFGDATPEALARYYAICLPKYQSRPASPERATRIVKNLELTNRFCGPGGEGQSFDFTSELARILCPTLVLAGADDPITPPARSRAIASAIGSRAELHVLERCRHNVVTERPDAGPDLVRQFIVRVAATQRRPEVEST